MNHDHSYNPIHEIALFLGCVWFSFTDYLLENLERKRGNRGEKRIGRKTVTLALRSIFSIVGKTYFSLRIYFHPLTYQTEENWKINFHGT